MDSTKRLVNHRILVIDDNQDVQNDFRKILLPAIDVDDKLSAMEKALFKEKHEKSEWLDFNVDFASQGEEGFWLATKAEKEGKPYAMAFIDIRMPPGWDGVETARNMWREVPDMEVVFCSAYSDYTLKSMVSKLDGKKGFLILKKPFDSIEIRQLAISMCEKWCWKKESEKKIEKIHEQLLRADRMAAIGQLASGIAHEINNPISFISSNINTLQMYVKNLFELLFVYDNFENYFDKNHEVFGQVNTIKDKIDYAFMKKDAVELLEETSNGIDRVAKIVQDLREFSHIDKAKFSLSNLSDGMDKTLTILRNEIKYNIEVIKEYEDVPLVECMGSQINQVFLNILINALQSIEGKGSIHIKINTDTKKVWVEISDNGKGIDKNIIDKIFDPFFTTKAVGEGTGLGLSISYSIIQKHHGDIYVKSEAGIGTTFTIILPITQRK